MNKADTLRSAFNKALEARKLDPHYWGAELSDSNLVSRNQFHTYEILMPSPDLKSGERVKSISVPKDQIEKGEVDKTQKMIEKILDSDYKDYFKVWKEQK